MFHSAPVHGRWTIVNRHCRWSDATYKSQRFRARCCHSSCPQRHFWRLIPCPDLAFGESYMDGDLQIESGSIDDLLALLIANNNQWNRARPSTVSPCQKINMPMPKPVSSQHRKPNISIKNFVIIATKLANLIKLYQLACLNMSARHIYPAILPVSPDCCPPMVCPLCIRLVSAAHLAAVTDGSINISYPAGICLHSNR